MKKYIVTSGCSFTRQYRRVGLTGNEYEIKDFRITASNNSKSSRSGEAIMIPKGEWRVPTSFGANSFEDNFVTRELEEIGKDQIFLATM
jgi:hypothetical protein